MRVGQRAQDWPTNAKGHRSTFRCGIKRAREKLTELTRKAARPD